MSVNPHDLILAPVLSEKAMSQIEDSRYVFFIKPGTNRVQIRKAVETVFKVDVVKINLIKVRGKERRRGMIAGRTADRLKAVVTLKPGQRIEQLEGLS
jgi:large subunit ribosomal protein L23